jgi:ubiquinone/menaquinone biosynthesis C-methylase UbiE
MDGAGGRVGERDEVDAAASDPTARDAAARDAAVRDAAARALATYDAAADTYDDAANTFWSRFGRRTVEHLALQPGDRVLDVCCGAGASALPAAEAVGPGGSVLGLDLSERLLSLARAKAHARGLRNVEFRRGNLLDPPAAAPDGAPFDAVVCVFGIFFVPDMPAAVRALWRVVRPGGRLAITTWGPRLFEPGNAGFWNAIRDVRPELHKAFNPWDRISTPADVRALLVAGGAGGGAEQAAASGAAQGTAPRDTIDVVAEADTHSIPTPEAWWALVLGSGYRGTLDQLAPTDRERVRRANLEHVRRAGLREVEANVVYAVAIRPRDPEPERDR